MYEANAVFEQNATVLSNWRMISLSRSRVDLTADPALMLFVL